MILIYLKHFKKGYVNIYRVIYLFLIAILFSRVSFAQESAIIKEYKYQIPGDLSSWYFTGVTIKKGQLVQFEVSGEISLGFFAGNVDASGTVNPVLLQFNRSPNAPHGALICNNTDQLIVAKTKFYFQLSNPLNVPGAEFYYLSDAFIGSMFISSSDQELKFIINDADYQNNFGSFTVSVKIFNDLNASKADYLTVPDCQSLQPQEKDVIIYKRGGFIRHSGIVTKVDSKGHVIQIQSKYREKGLFFAAPNETPYGQEWEIYRTNRGSNTLHTDANGYYETDLHNTLKTPIDYLNTFWQQLGDYNPGTPLGNTLLRKYSGILRLFYPDLDFDLFSEMLDYGYNCHGFTFANNDTWLDDGVPIQKILHDNGYCRVYINKNVSP